MKPLKAHQQCKALQIRKEESRKAKTLETAQIEEQLFLGIALKESKQKGTKGRILL